MTLLVESNGRIAAGCQRFGQFEVTPGVLTKAMHKDQGPSPLRSNRSAAPSIQVSSRTTGQWLQFDILIAQVARIFQGITLGEEASGL